MGLHTFLHANINVLQFQQIIRYCAETFYLVYVKLKNTQQISYFLSFIFVTKFCGPFPNRNLIHLRPLHVAQNLGVICYSCSLFALCLRRINLKNKTIHTSCGEFQETPMPHRGTYIIFYYLRYLRTICRSRNNVWFLKSEDKKYY